ncbi:MULTISPECIES: hypothetical protein [Xanthomonas]|uniref:hypothetical protein n=1 Tax=Xanthomonas TaxID=338 RepID=UPI000C59762D|nr:MULTISPECIES: hypothetical protein [Xanthomonas]QTD87995.1 hypothetical protein XcfCFBP6988P_23435 [Xanthomonas citri pv. phaseoli var. fuscans]QTF14076.1 hypothetical protein XcfCFBP6989P_23350 [Xanthomonas citri pv. phaseoli var. fuscans]QTF14300.1 hypothetical protein XcfCFBP6991P_24085 [Xanthomonas citri pv. phaseoli var. fuscans]QTF76276.1 hypothetical protein XcfCFBP6990P_23380 [Xanthomonas citri pv. phaseoli var. fuscans]UZB00234.1 hypothetical protein OM946_02990 [Xanthomonas citri 
MIPLAILSWKLSCGLKIEHADEGACGRSVSGGLEIGQFHFSLKEIKNDSAFKKRLLPKGRVLHCARIVGRLRHIGKRTTGSARKDFHSKLQRQRKRAVYIQNVNNPGGWACVAVGPARSTGSYKQAPSLLAGFTYSVRAMSAADCRAGSALPNLYVRAFTAVPANQIFIDIKNSISVNY